MKTPVLNAESHSPLYRQLMRKLRADIASGVYPVHSRIPSEQELCDKYQVSRVTVRKALAELTQEGLLNRQQGKGTFVGVPRLCKDLKDVNSFHDACRLMNCTPSTRVIHAQLTYATEEDARDLLCESDQVVETLRLRLADDTPVMLETNRFPLHYEYLLQEDLTGSLYGILQEHGIEANQAVHEISLTYATASQAKYLCVNEGDALLNLREIIYDQYGRPLHTSKQLIRGDRFTFRI
ncbi:MAG: GntR family transcriptional regulator [Clostridia bacterium]|nr:GntR family transcriptional regulator [Clostridia bacterium]